MTSPTTDLDDPKAVDDLIRGLSGRLSQGAPCTLMGNSELTDGSDACGYYSFFMGDLPVSVPDFTVTFMARLEHCDWKHDRNVLVVRVAARGVSQAYLLTAEFEKGQAGGQIQYSGWSGEPEKTFWDGSVPRTSNAAV